VIARAADLASAIVGAIAAQSTSGRSRESRARVRAEHEREFARRTSAARAEHECAFARRTRAARAEQADE
jgi:hypothetical protein